MNCFSSEIVFCEPHNNEQIPNTGFMVSFIKYDLLDPSWILQPLPLDPCSSQWLMCLMSQC